MAYEKQWGAKSPGHLLFLIDQSGSMAGENARKVVDAVHAAITETINNCISGTAVKNRVYITIIGYGNPSNVSIIKEGWASEYAKDLMNCRQNNTKIIEPVAYGGTPMKEGFEMTKKYIEKWLKSREQICQHDSQASIPAPIVINITDGFPNDVAAATRAARDILELETPDGKVIVFNIHMSEEDVEIKFPKSKDQLNGCREGEFLFEITSEMTPQFIEAARMRKFEGILPGAKGFVVNANGDTLVQFIQFGSSVSEVIKE